MTSDGKSSHCLWQGELKIGRLDFSLREHDSQCMTETSKSFRDTLVVMNTDYIGSYKFTYNMITTTTAPSALVKCGQYLFSVKEHNVFTTIPSA
jgi:hypothetical protein